MYFSSGWLACLNANRQEGAIGNMPIRLLATTPTNIRRIECCCPIGRWREKKKTTVKETLKRPTSGELEFQGFLCEQTMSIEEKRRSKFVILKLATRDKYQRMDQIFCQPQVALRGLVRYNRGTPIFAFPIFISSTHFDFQNPEGKRASPSFTSDLICNWLQARVCITWGCCVESQKETYKTICRLIQLDSLRFKSNVNECYRPCRWYQHLIP